MRKVILKITSAVMAMATLSACSNEDMAGDVTVGSVDDALKPSEIEISLGGMAEDMKSRLSIETVNGAFSTNKNDTLGVYALATTMIDRTETPQIWPLLPIQWAGEIPIRDKDGKVIGTKLGPVDNYSIWLDNARAYVMNNKVVWDNPYGQYYPMISLHTYSFYAYNPRIKEVTYYPDHIEANYTDLKGCEDVIWGCIEPKDAMLHQKLAYCADYFRQQSVIDNPTQVKNDMTFHFKHKMMRLTFDITAGAKDEKEVEEPTMRNYDEAYKTKVHSIAITNVPEKVTLTIADKREDGNMQGNLTYSGKRNKTYYLKERRWNDHNKLVLDSLLTPVSPKPFFNDYVEGTRDETNRPAVTKIGDGIILPALTYDDKLNKPYKMKVLLEYPEGVFQWKEFTLESSGEPFYEGFSYNISLKIYSPEDVSWSATKEQWQLINEEDYNKHVDPIKEETEKRKEEEEKDKEE